LVVAVLLLSKYEPSLSLPRQANVSDVTLLLAADADRLREIRRLV
jgi:hypothetical protein